MGTVDAGAAVDVTLAAVATPGAPTARLTATVISDSAEGDPDPHPNSATIDLATRYASPPTITFSNPPDDETVLTTTTITYAATAADAVGDDLSQHIAWSYVNADDPDATPISLLTGQSGFLGPLDAGNWTLIAHVDDGSGQSTTRTETIHVIPATWSGPDLGIIAPNIPASIPAGHTVTFPVSVHNFAPVAASGIDLGVATSGSFYATLVDHHTSTSSMNLYQLAPGATRTVEVSLTATGSDPGTVSFNVTSSDTETNPDPHPNSITSPITIAAADPDAPTVTITAPDAHLSDFATTTDTVVNYAATASDPTDGDLSSQIAWTLQPLDDPTAPPIQLGTGASGSMQPVDPGAYLLTAHITDSLGKTATTSLVVTNLAPSTSCSVAASFTPVSGIYQPGTMTVSAAASFDTCGRPLQFDWDCETSTANPSDCLHFNTTMNDADEDIVTGQFQLQASDNWIIDLSVCAPAIGSISGSCTANNLSYAAF